MPKGDGQGGNNNHSSRWCEVCQDEHEPCPTLEEIDQQTANVQAGWSAKDERHRRVTKRYIVEAEDIDLSQVHGGRVFRGNIYRR